MKLIGHATIFITALALTAGLALAQIPGGGGPTGPAGGGLTGTYPNPTVATVPATALPALTGDVTSSAGSAATTVVKINGATPGPAATAAAGQIPGTATNDNACAGCVGQFLSADCPGVTTTATVTITIATPAVVTWTTPPFHNTLINQDNCPIVFTTTGALPTGITAGTTYWVIASSISGNTFQIATSVPNALAGTAVATSGTQSGVQTATASSTLANNTAKSVGGLAIPAGDWDISALCGDYPNGATTSSQFVCNLSLTDNVLNTTPSDNMALGISGASVVAGTQTFMPTNTGRFLFASTTNVYVVMQSTFAISTKNAAALIHARRMR